MRFAIDTNQIVDFFRGDFQVKGFVQRAERISVPFAVVAELRAGFLSGNRSLKNEGTLGQFLSSPRVEILFGNEDTTHHYARLYAQLRKQGTPIPTNDLWIAAICLQSDLPLLTRDRDFMKIPQLVLL